ncbi:MAG: sel1 repeat family protein [Beijerinckiaceae bacterium]|nr:MAG: sel1 repeat family protein [Beijerinckiaceae bacterium]
MPVMPVAPQQPGLAPKRIPPGPQLPTPESPEGQAATNASPTDQKNVDLAYGAYQRGYYKTALTEAMKRVAANKHDGVAMTLIGEIYEQGFGVKQDDAEAAKWYAAAAAEGDASGMFKLGLAKLRGKGVPKDPAGAKALFRKAAAKNNAGALYNLGILELQKKTGGTPDFKKAADYFGKAAEFGLPDADYALGLLYRKGRGVVRDDKIAALWMSRAARENNIPGEVEYAIMLFNGIGVAKDETAAARLFLKAAAANNPVAQDRIARLLVVGRGIKSDLVQAMKWHILARAAGEKDPWLDTVLNKLTPDQKKQVETAVHQYVGY